MNNSNIVFGKNPVREALKSNRVISIEYVGGFKDEEINQLINLHKVKKKIVNSNDLDRITSGAHQGILAYVKPFEYTDLNSLITISKKSKNPLVVILDGIEDPHNLGAIIRSADVFSVDGIIISKHNQVPVNETVLKTSAGAANFARISLVNNINQAIEELKKNGYWIVSTDGSATQTYDDLKYDFPVGLIIGSEGRGISKLTLKNSDYLVKIPQSGHVNSLNASVATGILLSYIRIRQSK